MHWSHWVMLSFGTIYAMLVPVVLVKAYRRREWQRFYELVVSALFTSGWLPTIFWPTAIQNVWAAWPSLRWLCLLFAALFLADWFGFSGWLFNRQRKQRI